MCLRLVLWILLLSIVIWSNELRNAAALDQTIRFSGYDWHIRSDQGAPGDNTWAADNVWLDHQGHLHLKLAYRDGQWTCAEIALTRRLGFGRYEFWVGGRIDRLDKNVVLGLFNYTTPDIGPDGTNEIDIEFAKWGTDSAPPGSYTVWPGKLSSDRKSKSFDFTLSGDHSTHRFTWASRSIHFQSLHGHRRNNIYEYAQWIFAPKAYAQSIPQVPLPVHINLWLRDGQPPFDGKEVEIVIRNFKFTPQ